MTVGLSRGARARRWLRRSTTFVVAWSAMWVLWSSYWLVTAAFGASWLLVVLHAALVLIQVWLMRLALRLRRRVDHAPGHAAP